VTIRALRRTRMHRAANSRTHKNVPVKLTSMVADHFVVGYGEKRPGPMPTSDASHTMAAQQTIPSYRMPLRSNSSNAARTSSSRDTSARTKLLPSPARSIKPTVTPRRSSNEASAAPIPPAPPVMITELTFKNRTRSRVLSESWQGHAGEICSQGGPERHRRLVVSHAGLRPRPYRPIHSLDETQTHDLSAVTRSPY
jgi:hypothetical protein